jgi:anti-anti-sigma factor
MPGSPKFFTVANVEGVPEITLGTADFVSRPIIVMAQEEITNYIDKHKPSRLVVNFKNVGHISSEFITGMIRIQDHVTGNGGKMKLTHMNETVYAPFKLTNLAGRLFLIYETTPEAIDAF